jgi:zinc transport system substrate-binding protein
MLKKFIALLIGLAVLLGLAACGGKPDAAPDASGGEKIKVFVTFDAIKEFTTAVGGDRVDVIVMIPDGTEPHDFEPKASDIAGLGKAQVFVYNGFGMETWVDQTIKAVNNKDLTVVEASKGAEPITNDEPTVVNEHGQYDPHLWLSLKGAEIEARNIRDGLIKADPSAKDVFNKNCDDFIAQLESVFNEYSAKFQAVTNKDFVTGHAAFSYLCRDFGLRQSSVEDVFAEGEPTAAKLAELVDYCKTNHIKTIFMESLVSPAVSQTLASEVGAQVKTIYTIASSENGKTYLQRMQENLAAIYDSLKQ